MSNSGSPSTPRPIKAVGPTSSASRPSVTEDDDADTTLSLTLLNAGKRVLKGKLRQIDPRRIRRSRFANRAIEDVHSIHYQSLVELLRHSGTNIVPALADEIAPSDASDASDAAAGHDYELVYGHRRHQVCLAEGLPLTVIVVQALDDVERTFLMAQENEGRVVPCPLDMGLWLAILLQSGGFASQSALARATSIKPASVTNLLKLARLPAEVVAAFNDRSELAHRHALPLEKAASEDLDGLICRAQEIVALRTNTGGKIDKRRVLAMLEGKLSIDAAALDAERPMPLSAPTSTPPADTDEALETSGLVHYLASNAVQNSGAPIEASVNAAAAAVVPANPVVSVEEAPPRQIVKRLNRALPLVTNHGKEPGQVFTDDDGDTFIRMPFTMDEGDLDWFAMTLGALLTDAPFLHKTRLPEEQGESDHG